MLARSIVNALLCGAFLLVGCAPARPTARRVRPQPVGLPARRSPRPPRSWLSVFRNDQFQSEYQPLKSRLGNYPISVNMCETLVPLGEELLAPAVAGYQLGTGWQQHVSVPPAPGRQVLGRNAYDGR